MIRKIAIIASAMSCLTLGVIGANGASAASGKAHVLTEEGNVGVTFTQNFNPFNSNSLASQMSIKSLTYEPLFEFDYLKANTQYPWLATSYKWTNGGRTINFTIRKGVKWSDGRPLTPRDVAYTFNLIGQNPSANYSGVPQMTNPATVRGDVVSLSFASPAYQSITSIAGSTLIVPEHLWSRIANPAKVDIKNPVGTGPYILRSYSSQMVTYRVNPNYWDGHPAATQVNIPAYSSNNSATTALANGQLDWSGNDIANIQSVFVNKNPKTNHYYFAPGSTVTLMFNVKYGALGDPVVRQAISAGINRTELGVKAESGYEKPATSSSALILPNQSAFLSPKVKNDLSPTSNPAKVASLLSGDGYVKNSAGMWVKDGKEIAFNIEDPTAYSDYYAGAQLIASSLQSEGINATVDGVQASQWYSDLAAGTFQSVIHWGAGGANPFQQYQNWLDYDTFVAPNSSAASGDFGRYQSTDAQRAIKKLETISPLNTGAINAAVQALGNIMTTQVPVAPLLYGADWNVYSTARFTGWVTAANPYMDPSPSDPALPVILMHLRALK